METQSENEKELWQIAKKRVAFKWTFMSYIIVNIMLIAIWYYSTVEVGQVYYFWPKWPLLGWGVGLAFQYLNAYHGNSIFNMEKEYEKIKKNNQSNINPN